jgi:hypothetical protein
MVIHEQKRGLFPLNDQLSLQTGESRGLAGGVDGPRTVREMYVNQKQTKEGSNTIRYGNPLLYRII